MAGAVVAAGGGDVFSGGGEVWQDGVGACLSVSMCVRARVCVPE